MHLVVEGYVKNLKTALIRGLHLLVAEIERGKR